MKKILVLVGMIVTAGCFTACGGSGSKSSAPVQPAQPETTVVAPAITTPTAISGKDAAAKAVNATKTLSSSFASSSAFPSLSDLLSKPVVSQAANANRIISTVRDLQLIVAGVVEKQKALGKQVAAASPTPCPGGGSMSYDAASNPLVVTYTACKMDNEVREGTITMPQALRGQASGTGGTLSVNLITVGYAAFSDYKSKEHESVQNYTMMIEAFDKAAGSANFTINGSGSKIDYLKGTSNKLSFGNFKLNMTQSMSGNETTTSMAMDGKVSMDSFKDTLFTATDSASGMTFKNLRVKSIDKASGTNTLNIEGTYAIKTNPACLDGTFEITTQNEITSTSAGITSGQITVNGIIMVFNADGTVTATINNEPKVIGAEYASVCSLSF